MFAKLFETDDLGQLLVMKHATKDKILLSVFSENTDKGSIVSLNTPFPDTEEGAKMCEDAFDAMDAATAHEVVTGYLEYMAEVEKKRAEAEAEAAAEKETKAANQKKNREIRAARARKKSAVKKNTTRKKK